VKSSLNINLVAKLRKVRLSGHIEHVEDVTNTYELLENPGAIGKITLKWILK
jgi:hypothetical protein